MNKIAVQKCSLGGGCFLLDSVFLPQDPPWGTQFVVEPGYCSSPN